MNWTRGLFRLWIALSALWFVALALMIGPAHVATAEGFGAYVGVAGSLWAVASGVYWALIWAFWGFSRAIG